MINRNRFLLYLQQVPRAASQTDDRLHKVRLLFLHPSEKLFMISANLTLPKPENAVAYLFKRREFLPFKERLWHIEAGAVRTLTVTDDGTIIPLGFWGVGDVVGQPLSRIQPYQMECLTEVKVQCLEPDQFWHIEPGQCWQITPVMLNHIHQMQELLRIRNGQIAQRLQQLLEWLAYKFGRATEQGQLIELRLTHQDIADAIGATRVTVTRLLHQFEEAGQISLSRRSYILLRHHS